MNNKIQNGTTTLQLLFIGFVGLIIVCASLLAAAYHTYVHPVAVDPAILIARFRVYLLPKPEERAVFVILGCVVPLLCFFSSINIFRRENHSFSSFGLFLHAATPLIVTAILIFPFLRFQFGQSLASGVEKPGEHPVRILGACFLVSMIYYLWRFRRISRLSRLPSKSQFSLLISAIFLAAMLLQILSWRVVGENSLSVDASWSISADAIIYAVGEVWGGKTILADLPSQYGMFPEFIGSLLSLTGYSLLSFSILCAAMQVIAMSSVVYVLQKLTRDPLLKVAAVLAFVMITFFTCLHIIGISDPYFQYWPIRFFWPAVSVLAFYQYTRNHALRRAAVVSAVGGIGALWNADTGLMIVLAFGAVLAAKWVVLFASGRRTDLRERARVMTAIWIHIGIVVLVAATFFAYIALKATLPVHWEWLYSYQRLFYGLGFAMLPMPMHPHAWMTVIGVYLLGLLVACAGLAQRPKSSALENVLFLSLLGLGLFVYYEGRSHILNLITVAWPAVVIASILADRILRAVRARKIGRVNLALPIAALAVFIYCSIPLVINVPKLYADTLSMYRTRHTPNDSLVHDEIAFIRANSHRGQQCLILSLRQGLYYAETGMTSPLTGPGYVETLLQADLDAMFKQIADKLPPCIFLGIGQYSAIDPGGNTLGFLDRYSLIATNPARTMKLYAVRR